ncbi:hypothetical protein ACFYOD_37720 [Streptomyces sp. NPDC006703]|uniref:hypothetical protein n=1 Tax=Streptomyces sp. NPDC006703 TaxID=3364759 RepID=UPI00367529C7
MPPPLPPEEQPPPPPLKRSGYLEKAALVAAPGTIVVGLLYYIGSVYTKAYYTTLGVLPEDLGFSFQGILANSPSALFLPLWLLLVGGLIVLLLGWVGRWLAMPAHAAWRRAVIRGLLAARLIMLVVGVPVFFENKLLFPLPHGSRLRELVPALVMALGATLAFFAVLLRVGETSGAQSRPGRTGDRLWLAGGALLLGLLTLCLVFDMVRYVAALGRGNAVSLVQQGYPGTSYVVVHSRAPLATHATDITPIDHGSRSGPYRYEYLGFRILAKAPTRFYRVSYASHWKDRDVVALPDNDNFWMEISSSQAGTG